MLDTKGADAYTTYSGSSRNKSMFFTPRAYNGIAHEARNKSKEDYLL
jgi:hypothetical protein